MSKDNVTPIKEEVHILDAKEAAERSKAAIGDLKVAVNQGLIQAAQIGVYVCSFQVANYKTWERLVKPLEDKGYRVELYPHEAYVIWGDSPYCVAYKLLGPSPVLEAFEVVEEDGV